MDTSQLYVITAVSNPLRWESRTRLAKDFIQHMLEARVKVILVECAYGDRPYELDKIPGIIHVPVYAQTPIWSKERLLNIGIHRAPRDARYFAWFDADIRFRKPGWAAEIIHALQHHPVIQPWSEVYDLGPHDEHLHVWRSFAKIWVERPHHIGQKGSGYEFAHPGYAWAATRTFLEQVGGLLEIGAMGAGDHHMALGMVGKPHLSLPGGIHPNYKNVVLQWAARAQKALVQGLGYLPFTIEHAFHGEKSRRKYIERWDVLIKHGYDPHVDIKTNTSGVIEYAGNKPGLIKDHWAYLRQRNEDANFLY